MKVRVKFSKHGALKFIGHLDVMRYFQKCIRRAEIDIAYSGGYSPHQIMTFAQPLGVGLESDGEYMDLQLNSDYSCAELIDRLNAASVKEIRILNVVELPENAPNAMASVAAARYSISFREGRAPKLFLNSSTESINDKINEYLHQDEIIVERMGKAGIRQINIKDGIYEFIFNGKTLELFVNCSSAGNVKATDVMNTFICYLQDEILENAYMITRMDTYAFVNDDTTDLKDLVPMDQVKYPFEEKDE